MKCTGAFIVRWKTTSSRGWSVSIEIQVSLLIGSNNNDRRAYVSIMSTVTFVLSLFVDIENLISPSVNEVLNFQERTSGTGGWVGGLLTSAHFKLVAK